MRGAGNFVGTVTGGLLADKLRGVTRQPYLAACVIGMVPATVLCAVALHVEGEPAILGSILACQVCLWFYNGPVNTLLVSSVSVAIRARAFSLSILAIHVLGDVVSPPLIGAISDATGDLKRAVLVVPVALGVAAVIWLLGWRWLPESLPEAAAA